MTEPRARVEFSVELQPPVLRIDIWEPEASTVLYHLFHGLARAGRRRVDLSQVLFVEYAGLRSLVLESTDRPTDHRKAVHVRHDATGRVEIRWVDAHDRWDDTAALFEPFLDGDSAGHQYFSGLMNDDAVVVVA